MIGCGGKWWRLCQQRPEPHRGKSVGLTRRRERDSCTWGGDFGGLRSDRVNEITQENLENCEMTEILRNRNIQDRKEKSLSARNARKSHFWRLGSPNAKLNFLMRSSYSLRSGHFPGHQHSKHLGLNCFVRVSRFMWNDRGSNILGTRTSQGTLLFFCFVRAWFLHIKSNLRFYWSDSYRSFHSHRDLIPHRSFWSLTDMDGYKCQNYHERARRAQTSCACLWSISSLQRIKILLLFIFIN